MLSHSTKVTQDYDNEYWYVTYIPLIKIYKRQLLSGENGMRLVKRIGNMENILTTGIYF